MYAIIKLVINSYSRLVSSVQQLFQLYSFLFLNRQIMRNRLAKTMMTLIYMKLNSWSSSATNGGGGGGSGGVNTPGGFESRSSGGSGGGTNSVVDSADFLQSNFEFYLINTRLRLIILYSVLSVLVMLTLVPAYAFVYLKYKERFMIEEAHFLSAVFGSRGAKTTSTLAPESTGARIRQQLSDDEDLRLDKMSLLEDDSKIGNF